jgi:hypothetical protein
MKTSSVGSVAVLALSFVATPSYAQTLGTFRWQLQPYCNIVTVTITAVSGLYTLDGFDDQCSAPQRAPVVGSATQNPDGSIGLGFTAIAAPSGTPVHVSAAISIATLGGTWSDSAGGSGAFAFTPASGTGGSPRPLSSAGDITAVVAGAGLSGGATTGVATLTLNIGYEVLTAADVASPSGGTVDRTVLCPTGKRVVAGGYNYIGVAEDLWVWQSGPTPTGNGWTVRLYNLSTGNANVTTTAICAVM